MFAQEKPRKLCCVHLVTGFYSVSPVVMTTLLSRLRPANRAAKAAAEKGKKKIPELDEFLATRDYQGAIALLEFRVYEWMLSQENCPREVHVYIGCCLFFMGLYAEARDAAEKAEKSELQNRLLFYVAHKLMDERRLLQHHSQLKDSIEDQLCLASLHFLRTHYQQAADIYKKLLGMHKNFIALNVYLAICYYKLDYYDVSMEVLQVYLNQYPDSAAGINLKACCLYKLFSGPTADSELEHIRDYSLYPFARDMIAHNRVVFKNGDGALQILPPLLDIVPEARVNLVLYYLRRDEIDQALRLVNDLEPSHSPEFIVKAMTFTLHGQAKKSEEHLKTAELFYKMVGESPADCDTIPGRQAMAACFFLQKQWDEVIVYLNSIKQYFLSDDAFFLNYAQALLMMGNYVEAESMLNQVQGEEKRQPLFSQLLTACLVKNKKPQLAWDLLKRTKAPEQQALLKIIANGCYKMGYFFYSFLAFDQLERLDPTPENWQGKKGATAGLFKQLAHDHATREQMSEALSLLAQSRQPQAEQIVGVIRGWARENGLHL
ncbi:unnamed protein product, partial [Mesorhabditis spiculigera]